MVDLSLCIASGYLMSNDTQNAWLDVSRGVIHPWHHDQFGHMNVRWYSHFFDDAIFHLWACCGVSLQSMERDFGVHSVTARSTINFVQELTAGDAVRIEGGVTRLGGKSISFTQRMRHIDTGEIHALNEVVEVFFDPATRKSTTMPDSLRTKLAACVVELED
jgi:acyl-CoA thioester hydrolase